MTIMENQQGKGINIEVAFNEAMKHINNLNKEIILLKSYARQLEMQIDEMKASNESVEENGSDE